MKLTAALAVCDDDTTHEYPELITERTRLLRPLPRRVE